MLDIECFSFLNRALEVHPTGSREDTKSTWSQLIQGSMNEVTGILGFAPAVHVLSWILAYSASSAALCKTHAHVESSANLASQSVLSSEAR